MIQLKQHIRRRLTSFLQIAHLVTLFLVPILWFAVTKTSEPEDIFARTVTAITGLSIIAWGSLVVVLSIRYGDKAQGVHKLFSLYRRLLASLVFLIITDILLVVALTVLTYQVIAYRQVEFSARLAGQLISSDAPGSVFVLGRLTPNEPKLFRLRTGRRYLAFQRDTSIVALPVIEVRPWWRDLHIQHIEISVKEEDYELLK